MKLEKYNSEITEGKYAWPGGYERHLVMADGEAICFDCAERERQRIQEEIAEPCDPAWRPLEFSIHWEGAPIQCAHCNREIESAYGETKESDQ